MAMQPRTPFLAGLPLMILTVLAVGLLMYAKSLLQPGSDMGSSVIGLIVGSVALLCGLLALGFLVRMIKIAGFSETISTVLLIMLVVYAEIMLFNTSAEMKKPPTDLIEMPQLSARDQAYTEGVVWGRENIETRESCEAQSKKSDAYAADFMRGCILELAIVVPKLAPFNTSNPDYKVFDMTITQEILPLLPDGVELVLAQRENNGYKIAIRASTKLEDAFGLANKNIKEHFSNYKHTRFKSDGNVMEDTFYIEQKASSSN